MTAEADKAPYGSAPKTQCKKWEKKLSRTNISRHTEIRKGIKLSGTRSDIQKKVVGEGSPQAGRFQRNHRATKVFEKLQVPACPEPTPKGIADHPLEVLSLHPSLFEFVLAKVRGGMKCSPRGGYGCCHQKDKLHWFPQECPVAPKVEIVLVNYKALPIT
ncbi:hypothetical protein JG687_00017363 [Phytophthora cactorum]|uniref:Uncharacterized protein n=1 Tax=Phytophthora cactorum TaxID=29920 RepID=A0A8T1TRI9_9STRA|nr:hypothetical protein JG687_00017363 [Phytophthora cactorum]